MKLYSVKIIREWEREVEATCEEEAQDRAYRDINDNSGDDFDKVYIDLLEDDDENDDDETDD